jgi:O-antigen/teichoic acid export membrane protein
LAIVRKQSIQGSIISAAGVLIGFVSSALLLPAFLAEEEIGLVRTLISYATLFSILAGLGFSQVTYRLFPSFKNDKNGHNGFLTLGLIFVAVGGLIFYFVSIGLQPYIVGENNSLPFEEYYHLITPVGVFLLIFMVLDNYLVMQYKAVIGILLKELLLRILILVFILLYGYHYLSFHQFANSYVLSFCIPTIFLLFWLLFRKNIQFKLTRIQIPQKTKKEIFKVASYGFFAGGIHVLLREIDVVMIKQLLGFKETGVYTVLFPFAILISIPARSVIRIATGVISEAWKVNDLTLISNIYRKSSNTLLVISVFLFLGIWLNIDDVLTLIKNGDLYSHEKYVVFFVGLAQVVDMGTGVNATIIATSKYYAYNTFFIIILLTLIITTNLVLIPMYGVTGAAIGTCISMIVYNSLRFVFLYVKFKLTPFNRNTIIIISIGAVVYFIVSNLTFSTQPLINILGIGSSITILYGLLIYFLKVSHDINQRIDVYWLKAKKILKL